MNADSENVSGAEEYVSISIELSRPVDPAAEKSLIDAIGKTDGVLSESLHISQQGVTLCYDPAKISQREIMALLKRAGVEAKTTEVDRAPFL